MKAITKPTNHSFDLLYFSDDIIEFDMTSLFVDENDEPIYISYAFSTGHSTDDFLSTPYGLDDNIFFGRMVDEQDIDVIFYATDMYGKTIKRIIHLRHEVQ